MKKELIGRLEIVDLPQLELFGLTAKVDTGAYTSAIHYHQADVIERKGKEVLHFTLLDPSHEEYNDKSFYVEKFKTKYIKNSFGQAENRFIVKLKVKIHGQEYETDFSLSNRNNLRHPVLLGRKILNKRFIVDTSKKFLSTKQQTK